jgi:hypothetical protein
MTFSDRFCSTKDTSSKGVEGQGSQIVREQEGHLRDQHVTRYPQHGPRWRQPPGNSFIRAVFKQTNAKVGSKPLLKVKMLFHDVEY